MKHDVRQALAPALRRQSFEAKPVCGNLGSRGPGQLASTPLPIEPPLLRWTDWQGGFDGRARAVGIDVETATELPHTLAHPRNADSRFPPSRLQRLQHGVRNASTLV